MCHRIPPNFAPSCRGSGTSTNTWCLGPGWPSIPNCISLTQPFCRFHGHYQRTEGQTDELTEQTWNSPGKNRPLALYVQRGLKTDIYNTWLKQVQIGLQNASNDKGRSFAISIPLHWLSLSMIVSSLPYSNTLTIHCWPFLKFLKLIIGMQQFVGGCNG